MRSPESVLSMRTRIDTSRRVPSVRTIWISDCATGWSASPKRGARCSMTLRYSGAMNCV